MYGLHGKFQTQSGKRDELMTLLLNAASVLNDFVGCYLYIVSADPDNDNAVWVTEVWQSQEDHQASLQLDAVRDLITSARPLLAGTPESHTFTPIGGKGLPESAE